MSYGFVRSTDTWGVNSIPWEQAMKAGLEGLAFSAMDPHLEQAIANAKAAKRKFGIWIPAGQEGGDPAAYARRISALAKKYGPDILIPNIEFGGKGMPGSKGWNWNEAMMAELQKLGVPANMAVAVLPDQIDFNYGAYTSRGARIMPEAFGADTGKDLFDPNWIRERLLKQGVPANMIDVLLAPSQVGKGSPGSLFTIDDISDWSKLAVNALAGHPPTVSPAKQAAVSAAMAPQSRARTSSSMAEILQRALARRQ